MGNPDQIHSPGFTSAGSLCGTGGPAQVDGVSCWSCLRILGRAKGPKVGDFVAVPYNNGLKNGCTTIYGVVEKAGRATFTVRWESGIRNRIDFAETKCVRRIRPEDLDPVAAKRLAEVPRG